MILVGTTLVSLAKVQSTLVALYFYVNSVEKTLLNRTLISETLFRGLEINSFVNIVAFLFGTHAEIMK